jgi:hypothetical protein
MKFTPIIYVSFTFLSTSSKNTLAMDMFGINFIAQRHFDDTALMNVVNVHSMALCTH